MTTKANKPNPVYVARLLDRYYYWLAKQKKYHWGKATNFPLTPEQQAMPDRQSNTKTKKKKSA